MRKFVKDYIDLAKGNVNFVKVHPVGTLISMVAGAAVVAVPMAIDVIKMKKLNDRIKKI